MEAAIKRITTAPVAAVGAPGPVTKPLKGLKKALEKSKSLDDARTKLRAKQFELDKQNLINNAKVRFAADMSSWANRRHNYDSHAMRDRRLYAGDVIRQAAYSNPSLASIDMLGGFLPDTFQNYKRSSSHRHLPEVQVEEEEKKPGLKPVKIRPKVAAKYLKKGPLDKFAHEPLPNDETKPKGTLGFTPGQRVIVKKTIAKNKSSSSSGL